MFEDGVSVRHKKEGYQGFIDGKTSLKECFTGNTDVKSQYRVRLPNSDIRYIAPEEDLEIIEPIKVEVPVNSAESGVKFKQKSFLMEAGYQLQLNANARRVILNNVIKEQNLYRVVSFLLRSTMFNRTGNAKRVIQNMNCLLQWGSDVDWMIENYKEVKDYASTVKLYEEMKEILKKRGYSWE